MIFGFDRLLPGRDNRRAGIGPCGDHASFEDGIRHAENRGRRIVTILRAWWDGAFRGSERVAFLLRVCNRAKCCLRDTASEVMKRHKHPRLIRRRRQRQHVVPLGEAQQDEHQSGAEWLECGPVEKDWCDLRRQFLRRFQRIAVLARHHRGRRHRIQVVRCVDRRIGRRRAQPGDVGPIDLRGTRAGRHRRAVVSGAHVGVRRHVEQVAGSRHERLQPLCTLQPAFRCQ